MRTLEQAAVATPAPPPARPLPCRGPAAPGRHAPAGVVAPAWSPSALLLATIVAASSRCPAGPLRDRPGHRLRVPLAEHLFGTDQYGRDVYTRVVYGTRESLLIGLAATALGLLLASAARAPGRAPRQVAGRRHQPPPRGPVRLPGPAAGAAPLRGLRHGSVTRPSRRRHRHAPGYARMIRGAGPAGALPRRTSKPSRALGHSPRAHPVRRTIFPNAIRPLVGADDAGDRPGHRLGFLAQLPRPRRRSRRRRSGAPCSPHGRDYTSSPGGSRCSPAWRRDRDRRDHRGRPPPPAAPRGEARLSVHQATTVHVLTGVHHRASEATPEVRRLIAFDDLRARSAAAPSCARWSPTSR